MRTVLMKEFNGHRLACSFTDAGTKNLVLMFHGFRGTNTGPNRFFVRLADRFVVNGYSTLSIDQYGSGNSEGDFIESRFDDWVATAKAAAKHYLEQGFQVSLLGQSMGGATVIVAASDLPGLKSIVAWAPGVMTKPYDTSGTGYMEESGQRVSDSFWQQAFDAKIPEKLTKVTCPVYIIQCSDDRYITAEDHAAIEASAQANHKVEMLKDHKHSRWTYDQATIIIKQTAAYLAKH